MPEINYFWDEIEDNVAREFDENNNTVAQYTTEPTQYGSVLSQDREGEVRHFQFDGLGNTTELTDQNGSVSDIRRYSAFGETTASSGATSIPFGFSGRWGYYNSSGTPHASIRRRTYDSGVMRWLSADPILMTSNRYWFLANQALAVHDPSGLIEVKVVSTDGYPTTSCNSGIEVVLAFRLSKPAPCTGYIVQLNYMRCLYRECHECPKHHTDCRLVWKPDSSGWIQPPHYAFFEAFYVEKNASTSTPPRGGNDIRRFDVDDEICGCEQAMSIIAFYCRDPKDDPHGKGVGTGNLGSLNEPPDPATGFVKGGLIAPQDNAPSDATCRPSPGDLPWHKWTPEPLFWKGKPVEVTDKPVALWHGVEFNCCACQKSYVNFFGDPLPSASKLR